MIRTASGRAIATEQIQPESLPGDVRQGPAQDAEDPIQIPQSGLDLEEHLEERRKRFMELAMERTGAVQTHAAEMLGMTFRSFRYFAKKYELTGRNEAKGAEATEEPELVGREN